MIGCSAYPNTSEQNLKRIHESKQFIKGKFRNELHTPGFSMSKTWAMAKDFFNNKSASSVPEQTLPIQALTPGMFDLTDKDALRFSRLGHSTVLIQLAGKYWLTDPVFSERTSPVQWAGPKRFHPVPIDIDSIKEIEAVLISHNHYDHLDAGSIKMLKDKVKHFVVPLGVGGKLVSWGVDPKKIVQLDWWENAFIDDVELVFTPAQHFSGRGMGDANQTLWGSWVIRTDKHSLYFSGDTGYFPGFKAIGERYGPFDYAFIECGAYNELWRDIHMLPKDSLQAFKDVKGKVMVPIHNGTFDLSTHAWFDPMEQITALANESNIDLLIPTFGQLIDADKKPVTPPWWKTR
ncbi:MAG: MBL fold metallo-hydrolase [Pseudomonadales bacterium]|nr:MBL fold metallo-hydrolase [Pseudomonadales bacterium]